MNGLLERAIEAHGGLSRWDELTQVRAAASITGAIWAFKGKPDALQNVVITAQTHREYLTMDFPGQDKRSVFEPDRNTIEATDGTVLERRDDPKSAFIDQARETPWDDLQVVYFSGEALWTYLTTPFLYTYPGFAAEEMLPWQEDGEEWRRLRVTFPAGVASHSQEQISYFGPDGLLRRHDYTVDILGGATGANYALDYQDIGGIIVPAQRRVYAYEENADDSPIPVPQPLLVSIDLSEISFR